jgi:hypothetical protein
MGKRREAITAWQHALDDGPKFKGLLDLYAPTAEAIALKCDGYTTLKLIMRLARAGHPKAISDLVRLARDLAQALEDTARLYPKEVQALAALVPDWPVMLCRHEVSNSPEERERRLREIFGLSPDDTANPAAQSHAATNADGPQSN